MDIKLVIMYLKHFKLIQNHINMKNAYLMFKFIKVKGCNNLLFIIAILMRIMLLKKF
jgi:hypothetical protein